MDSPAGWGLPGARADAPGNARATLIRRGRVALIAALAAASTSCRHADGPGDSSLVKTVTITAASTQIFVGATTHLVATLRDADGNAVLDRPAAWMTLAPTILSVSQAGDVTGLQLGTGSIRASSGLAGSEVTITVRNPIARRVALSRDTATIVVPGGSVQLIPTVTDDAGHAIANPFVTWTSSFPLVATVNVAGLATAVASGTSMITATVDGVSASMTVTVRPGPNALAPVVTSIIPLPLRPGSIITITGMNFASTVAGNQVVVDGIATTVRSASVTQLTTELPTAGFGCEPSRDAFVQVSAVVGAGTVLGGTTAPLQIANRRSLAPGQSLVVNTAAEVRCNELDPADGRWVVSVYNAARAPVTPSALGAVQFAIRGVARPLALGGTASPLVAAALPPAAIVTAGIPIASGRRAEAHASVLDRNLSALRLQRPALRGAALAPSFQVTTMGAISAVKLPNLDAPDFCVGNVPINARTVFVGPHAVILEDTVGQFNGKATLRGQMNDYFERLGEEFEAVMWPIIAASFGNPLSMDAQLGGSGRVVMVFSPRVNAMKQGSVVGYVANCDFFPASQRPSSNGGAYFYANVPTSTAGGYANPETRDQWLRAMRSTVIHEVKHVTAFAERISRGLALEDLSWEEGTARIAEEMYARAFHAIPAGANITYAQSIGCEIKFASGIFPCADRPLMMLRHFDGLYRYLESPENFTPLGRTTSTEFAFYSGAWSVLRWASDHAPGTESQFFRDFTVSAATGAANVEGRTGRSWEELLGEWSLTMYVDDLVGAGARNPRLFMPSWHLPDLWLGMCTDMGPCTNAANPIQTYLHSSPFSQKGRAFGDFVVGVGPMPGGGFTILDFSGPAAVTQVIELKSLVGNADPPASLRLAITRIR